MRENKERRADFLIKKICTEAIKTEAYCTFPKSRDASAPKTNKAQDTFLWQIIKLISSNGPNEEF